MRYQLVGQSAIVSDCDHPEAMGFKLRARGAIALAVRDTVVMRPVDEDANAGDVPAFVEEVDLDRKILQRTVLRKIRQTIASFVEKV